MSTVARLTLRRTWVRIASLALGFGLFVFVVGLSYASIDQNVIRSLVESLPPFLRAITGAADLASPSGYLGAAYVHPVVLTILGALVVSLATTPARDRESGAAELFLARPLPPWRWLAGIAMALVVGLVVVLVGGYLGGLMATLVVHDLGSVSPVSLAVVVLNTALVFAAVSGISLVIAVLARTGGQAVGWAAGFVVISYAVNYLAMLWTVARPLGYLSVFHRYDPGVVMRTGALPGVVASVLAVVAVAGAVIAHVLMQRREPSVT